MQRSRGGGTNDCARPPMPFFSRVTSICLQSDKVERARQMSQAFAAQWANFIQLSHLDPDRSFQLQRLGRPVWEVNRPLNSRCLGTVFDRSTG